MWTQHKMTLPIMMMACISHVHPLLTRRTMMTTAFSFSSTNSAISTTTRGGIRKQHYPYLTNNSQSLLHAISTTTSSSSEEEVWNRAAEEIDPYSEEAKLNLSNFYKRHNIVLDAEKDHKKLLRLTEQVLSWNQRLNLISRKDCTPEVVYHRHILPSIALLPLVLKSSHDTDDDTNNNNIQPLKIVDVGTGGGFPGLPLALLLPHCEFTLVDSIQKKLVAVSEMAAELDVENVRIHCGRCEEMYAEREGRKEHLGKYDVCLGRSVTALPRFCAWMYPLLKMQQQQQDEDGDGEEGRLIYIIGGELEDVVESRIRSDTNLDELLDREEGTSDKRALIFMANDVEEIAVESGEVDKIVRHAPAGTGKKSKKKKNQQQQRTNKVAKGAWQKRDNSVKKERGYDDFQRFEF
mmetsp:Transcript_10575/g.15583  ORF Transcript_10575/g.15583 Transcript_10575/m.15583 type:complete len:407 (+) Transcript_10575:74-1294(+)